MQFRFDKTAGAALAAASLVAVPFLYLLICANPVGAAGFETVPLVDQDGAGRTLEQWRGKVVVLDFIFTGCGDVCPIKTAQLADLQQSLDPALRSRVQFVSVSIDPEHDDPAALRAYAARTGANLADWSFLTGDLANIARFAAVFDAAPETGADALTHITTVRVLDQSGRVVARQAGEPLDETLLARDVAAASAS